MTSLAIINSCIFLLQGVYEICRDGLVEVCCWREEREMSFFGMLIEDQNWMFIAQNFVYSFIEFNCN